MLITDEIIAAAIKAAGEVVAATKREGGGTNLYTAQDDGRNIAHIVKAMIAELQ
ncbi:hypothetical protein ACFW81_02490 [Streptomyces angustmyceticus]|uniref:hypothetical protein n=1 Tax=Streptomyces angustmyceticus TaxID=285578 RepID=UPI0036ACE352